MPSRSCAAKGCPNNSRSSVGISYFKPATDTIKYQWEKACPDGIKNVKNFFLCSSHFRPEQKKTNGNAAFLIEKEILPTIWTTSM